MLKEALVWLWRRTIRSDAIINSKELIRLD